jgi:dihydrofolate reductase
MMGRLILKMSMSLDGFVGGPNGEIDWLIRTLDPDATEWVNTTIRRAGAHLVGRRTYADMVGYWPTSTEPLAAAMNTIPKIVFSRTGSRDGEPTTALQQATRAQRDAGLATIASAPGWEETRVLGAQLRTDVLALKARATTHLVAHGGASFARSLIADGLVDEYRLLVHPVTLGSGLPLFAGAPTDLTLVDTAAFAGGALGLTYRPVRLAAPR